ncbi:MAG: Ig-like domain-containing protein [Gammaproteobacteria bacterium]
MKKATFALATLALLVVSGIAAAAPITVQLQAHNQRSSGGTLSTLKWKACAPTGATNPCLSTTNAWTLANATGSTAVWTWDAATGVLANTGFFQTTSFVSSNANGSPVISDKVTDLVIDTTNNTTTAATYECVEGTFLASVGAVGCLNVSTGDDFANNSSAVYNVGGNANCVQRTVGGDDVSTGNPRGVATAAAAGACDPVDGAFDLWTVVTDDTATGGPLVVSNGIDQSLPNTGYLTFLAVGNAADDGPINVLQSIPQTLDVLANDTGFTGNVTVTISTPPTKGTATVQGTSPGPQGGITIEYTANAAATGSDTFVYQITDGTNTDTGTVTVNILAGGANNDTATTTRNSSAITINVGANDVGFTDPVTVTITGAPDQGGTATPGASGPAATATVSYTPATTASGTATYTETFTYTITDANLVAASGTVTVTVNNAIPVAGNGGVTISTQGSAPGTATGTFNAGTFAGNNLGNTPSVVTASQGTTGATSVSGNVVTYTPATTFFSGTDTFTYTITDADGETAMGTVTVTISDLTPALADGTITTTEGTASAPKALVITAGNGSVAQHTLTVSTQATNGSCALSGTSVVYTPNAAYTGGDSCVVTITDENGAGDSDTGTFTITVNAAGGGGGGGSGGLLPGGSGAVDPWSLSLLAGVAMLARRRVARQNAATKQ